MQLVRDCAFEDVQSQTSNWYARVASKSNVSDAASRLDFQSYARMGFKRVDPKYSHESWSGEEGVEKYHADSKAISFPACKKE